MDARTRRNQFTGVQFLADPRVPSPNALVDLGAGPSAPPRAIPLLPGTTRQSFDLQPATPGQAVTLPVVVTDSCGDWPTVVGGGAQVFGGEPGTPQVTAAPTLSAPVPTATGSPTPAPVCAPRPALAVATTPLGNGRLQATVTAPASSNDRSLTLRFGAATNARVDAGGQSGPGGFSVSLAAGSQQTTFMVSRVTAGQAVTVPLTVADSCGEWPTMVAGTDRVLTRGGAPAHCGAGRRHEEGDMGSQQANDRSRERRVRRLGGLVVAALVGAMLVAAAPPRPPSAAAPTECPPVRAAYGQLPLSFEANRGQAEPQVEFLARGAGYTLFLTAGEAGCPCASQLRPTPPRQIAGKLPPASDTAVPRLLPP